MSFAFASFPIAPVQQSITDLVRGCRDFGVFFSNERPYIQHVGNTMDVRRAITDTCKKAGYGPQNLPQLVVTYVSVTLFRATFVLRVTRE